MMKLLQVVMARSLWLFPTGEANPRGLSMLHVLPMIKERYGFMDVPDVREAVVDDQKAMSFRRGRYSTSEGDLEVSFALYRDGLVADTRHSTAMTDAFLEDLLGWLVESERLVRPSAIRKGYLSNVSFTTDGSLVKFHRAFATLAKAVSAATYLPRASFDLTGLTFGQDPAGSGNSPVFRIERDSTEPFDSKRYFSSAPLDTDQHLGVLTDFLKAIE
jgi:hypothetical protein